MRRFEKVKVIFSLSMVKNDRNGQKSGETGNIAIQRDKIALFFIVFSILCFKVPLLTIN